MKIKQIIIAGTLLVSVASFSQKDELKVLKKIYNKDVPSANDVIDYKAALDKLETLATEEGDKVYASYFKSVLPQLEVSTLGSAVTPAQIAKILTPKAISDLASTYNTTLEYEKKTGKKVFTDDINEDITTIKPILWNIVVALDGQKKNLETSNVLYSMYQLDKKDHEKLYLASNYALNAENYDKALLYLNELKAINYTGEGTLYYAKNTATDKEESFANKEDRNNLVKLGTHKLPREEKLQSKKGEIVKNIALILVQQGKTEEAKTAIADARKSNPDDASLILTEADLYYKLNDIPTYKKLIGEALIKNPNDADLVFNLGVVSAGSNQFDEAEKYYRKAIELKPDYYNAYLNLADLKLKPDAKLVEQINKLGTSDKDLKKYDQLKAERQMLFKSALPLLEKAYDLKPEDETVRTNLMTVYNFLEMTDKYKALKAKK